MAITTTTITKNAGWARTDVIDQLEQAFTWLGMHGTRISGLVTSISAYSGGGTIGVAVTVYYDVPVVTTSGIGTGATFDVYRNGGSINTIWVNRPGVGYTQGEYVTLSASNIGGGSAVAIGITVNVDGGASPVGYGSTNQFFDKNFTPTDDTTRPWGVLKQDFDTSKRFGVTYRGFKVYSNYQMHIVAGSSFFPYNVTNSNNRGGQDRDSFRGTYLLDVPQSPNSYSYSRSSLDTTNNDYTQLNYTDDDFRYATSNSPTTHALNLNIYRSGIDPNFAVLSYQQPTVTGTLSESTFSTFIIHDFTSSLYNFDETFSAGITMIYRDDSVNANAAASGANISFRTYLTAARNVNDFNCTRTSEAGWCQIYDNTHKGTSSLAYSVSSTQTNYTNSLGTGYDNVTNYNNTDPSYAAIFSRNSTIKNTGILDSPGTTGNRYPITTYASVIKGIPINGNLIPCPYYMPDDFVLIDFKLTASGQDIKQGDTITISGSEVYTVITGSYNKFNETAGILFCARKV